MTERTITQADIERATAETERLQRELDITNPDHIILWLEAQADGAPIDDFPAWFACRIVEAHEAAVAELRAENERLRKEQAILIKVMDAADRYNGVHTQSQQPMARMQGALMLAIQRAYRELGLSRDDLSRAALSQKETSHDD